jgi:hypothetical protein
MGDGGREGWQWIGDGAGLALADRKHWEEVGRLAGVPDPYRAKAAFVCGTVREFLSGAWRCHEAGEYLGASLLLMPPLEVFGRCVTGDEAGGREKRFGDGVELLNRLQRGGVAAPLDDKPVWKLRNFLAGGAVANDPKDAASLEPTTIDQLGRGLALALDEYWSSPERRASFAKTPLTALQSAGNPIYIAGIAGHLADGHRPSGGLAWAPAA